MVDRGKLTTSAYASSNLGFRINYNMQQYVPAPQEPVIGVVIARSGENWQVDIGSAHTATLDGLAFEGATKRNRPNLKVNSNFV